jgi:hypothetical protein
VTAPSAPKVGEPCWHVHHGDGLLFEYLTEPYEVRQQYIRENKPAAEVETRLRLFQPVRGTISPPKYWQEADAKWREAYAKTQEAYAKWQEAYAKRQEAYAKWQEADAKTQEAYAKWQEADAKTQEAYAKWREADAKTQEADAKWREADAKRREAYAKRQEADAKWRSEPSWQVVLDLHAKECPNCPWDGKTIFPEAKQ